MIRPITDTLRHIGGGVFIDTASDKLAELIRADKVLEAAANAIVDKITDAVQMPIFLGQP